MEASQIAELAYRAGWRDRDIAIATAVALAESGGDPNIKNRASGACGLWQIHPPQAGCENPEKNAEMAFGKWKSRQWRPWVAYTNGSYAKHMATAEAASKDVESRAKANQGIPIAGGLLGHIGGPAGGIVGRTKVATDPAGTLADFFSEILPKNFSKRAGLAVIGVFALGAGIVVVSKDVGATGQVARKVAGAPGKTLRKTAGKAKRAADAVSTRGLSEVGRRSKTLKKVLDNVPGKGGLPRSGYKAKGLKDSIKRTADTIKEANG